MWDDVADHSESRTRLLHHRFEDGAFKQVSLEALSTNGTYGPATVDAVPPSTSISQSLVGALAALRRLICLRTLGIVS